MRSSIRQGHTGFTPHTRRFGAWNRGVATLLLGIFVLQSSGCELLLAPDPVREGLQSLTGILEAEAGSNPQLAPELASARAIQAASEEASQILADEPDFGERAPTAQGPARDFVHRNHDRIRDRLRALEAGSEGLRRVIHEESRRAREAQEASVEARAQAVVYFALEHLRAYHRKAAESLMPYMVYTASADLRQVAEIAELNKEVTDSYFRHFGAQVVSFKDRRSTLASLREVKAAGMLPSSIEAVINRTQDALAGAAAGSGSTERLSGLSKEDRAQLSLSARELLAEFDGVTFLYTPEAKLNPLLDLLVIIGNLTWGLVNTLMGGGIVVWAVALSATGLIRLPRFAVAQNGRQIYVDVTGSNPLGIYGKMSMGLFELDNGTGYSFASGHEGAHAIQSALLGPFYVPVVLFTYMVSGFDRGFMEEWADAWTRI